MKRFRKVKVISSSTKQKILLLLLAGVTLGLTRSPRQSIKIIKTIPRAWKSINRDYLWRAVREFHHEQLVDWQEQKDGSILVTLTEKGKETTSRFDPDKLTIPKPNQWDNKWHLVIYDIPHKKKAARDALRDKLRELGFKEWQKSVFIHPYPGREQINFVIEFFDLRPYVYQAELSNPTNEAQLKLHFNLI